MTEDEKYTTEFCQAETIKMLERRIEELRLHIEHLQDCKEFESKLQVEIINVGAKYIRNPRGATMSIIDAWEAIKRKLGE